MKDIKIQNGGINYPIVFPGIVSILILLIGVFIFNLGFGKFYTLSIFIFLTMYIMYKVFIIKTSNRWKKINANIINFEIYKYDRYDKLDSNTSTPDYTVKIIYQYECNGIIFENNMISYDKSIYYFENDLEAPKKYLYNILNNDLYIYVNPKKCSKSILDNRIKKSTLRKYFLYEFLIIWLTIWLLYFLSY